MTHRPGRRQQPQPQRHPRPPQPHPRRRPPQPPPDDRGQAALELALVLPAVAVAFLALAQVALVVRDHVLVVHAAREAARAAAVDHAPGAARRAALAGAPLAPSRLDVETGGDRRRVTVTVRYRAPTSVPIVGNLVRDVRLVANASMRSEKN